MGHYTRSLEHRDVGQCLDLETAYGTKSSHARARYHEFYRDQRLPLERAGLWTGYRTSPHYYSPDGGEQAEFTSACDRLLYELAVNAQQFEQESALNDPTTGWRSMQEIEADNLELDLPLED